MGEDHFEVNFSLLYSLYSFPNILLPLFCGIMMDRIGLKVSVMILATFVLIGSIIVWWGCATVSWPLMLFGRALFGIGGESLQVAQSALLVQNFRGKEVALALGINLSLARLGSSINAEASPWITGVWGIWRFQLFGNPSFQ